jgi:hypothetical protein
MPIGAFKLNGIGRYLAPSGPVNASITSLGITSPSTYLNYAEQQLGYCGLDSSSRPVFVFSYCAVTTSYPSAIMFRINSDMSITTGSAVTLSSSFVADYAPPVCKTERDDIGLRTSSGYTDYVYFGWNTTNQIYASSASYVLDTLTLTAGTPVSIHAVNSGGIYLAYMGSRVCAIGGQGGSNGRQYVTDLITRTAGSTTLTKSGLNQSLSYTGQAGGHRAFGAGTNRFVLVSGGSNGHENYYIGIKYTGSTFITETVTPFYAPTTTMLSTGHHLGLLNTSGKVIYASDGTYSSAYGLRSQVIDNVFNQSSNAILPSHSEGAIVTDAATISGAITITNGSVDNEAYFVYVDSANSNNLKYKKLTANQDTITEGSWTSLDSGAQGAYPMVELNAKGVTVGSDYYLVAVGRDTTNSVFRVAAQKLATSSAVSQGTAVLRMEYITSATSQGTGVVVPATAAIGDFAILFDRSGSTTDTTPSGWTQINGVTTSGIRSNISYKKLVSGDPGASITGMGNAPSKLLMIFRSNTGTFTTASFSSVSNQATTAAPTAQTVVVSGQATPNLVFAHYASNGAVTSRGFTGYTWNDPVAGQELQGGSTTQYVKWYLLNKNNDDQTSNFTISMADNGTNTLQSFRVSFS